jgi:hypothetical protein
MPHALIALLLLIFWTASLWSSTPSVSTSSDPIGQFSRCGAIAGKIPKTDGSGIYQCSDDAGAATGAPTDAQYWLGAADGTLSAERNLGALATGLVLNTAGVPTTKAPNTCTNQFPRSDNASGQWSCSAVAPTDLSFDPATQAELDAHLADPTDAHAASAIGFTPNGSIAATTVQLAIQEVRDEGGAPSAAQYWLGAADATLSAEKNLGALATGLVINTAGTPSIKAGQTCTNQFPRSDTASGQWTCAPVGAADITDGSLTDADMATGNKDGAAGTLSLRTLGTGALQATAGNDVRLSDKRAVWTHATDCQGGGVTARLAEICVDLDDGRQWLCNSATCTTTGWIAAGGGAGPVGGDSLLSLTLEQLSATDDNMLFPYVSRAVTIKTVFCNYKGAAPTTVATFTLRNAAGTAMTHATPVCVASSTVPTPQNITAGGALAARELLRLDVSNTPNPDASQTYIIGVTYE